MATSSLLFDLNQLTDEQKTKFHTVYNHLKSARASYLEYKYGLQEKTKIDSEEEENEWHYELYRYLRARKWNIAHTIKSIQDMIQWRIDNRVDLILDHLPTSPLIDRIRKGLPAANHGYTKAHLPLYIEKTGLMHVDYLLHQFTTDELIQNHIYLLEFNCQLTRERSRQAGKHVENFALIYDLKGCKPDIRKTLHILKQLIYIDDNYYPERLGQMFVINPPLIFPAIWNLVKHWVDPVTKAKVNILKKGPDTSATLLQHIDSDQLPSEYGGSCDSCPTSPDCIPVYDWSKDTRKVKEEQSSVAP
ncbi:unnamed protein product [Didymodactylos carnosus]|uniref:CRAL-TRIO domain-containing protein n=1 Tax=Didymodactylos carnosus TaxID=1234261 RepID=A0A8S2HWH8_9BILA|nr:unnamed protein product [Didymodactylos carnosus]CAF3685120.1 unnamed protein product [Didymodactylos carnosus]